MAEPKEMTFLQHLEELRWHLVRSAAAILVFSIVTFIYADVMWDIVFGPINNDFITYRLLCDLGHKIGTDGLCLEKIPVEKFVNLQMASQITWHIWGAVISGFIIAFPYVAWEIWRFIKPALHLKERKGATGLVFYVTFLFLLGVFFGYFVLTPLTVNFLGTYNVMGRYVENQFVFTSYISTVMNVVLGCGLVFELPVAIYFLAKLGLVSPAFLKRYRKHAIIVILIVAAIITPPDVASQIMVSIPLLILYELSIFIAKRVYKEA